MHSRHLPLLLSALLGATAFAGAPGKVPLAVEYPKPLFAGTPRPISLSNLEPAGAKRPDIMVSAESKLLSRGKKVTSSDSLPVIGELSFITDGDKTGIDGAYVELGPNTQWVQVDLGAAAKIDAVAVWHFHSQARVYHDVVVQISDDPEFKKDVTTVYNNDATDELGFGKGKDYCYYESNEGRVIPVAAVKGRYVRFHSKGNSAGPSNDYVEAEVWGVPAK